MMELYAVDKIEYDKVVHQTRFSYNESWFHELNRDKVDELYYFLFKSKKYKFSIIAGVVDGVMRFPYSAPFSLFERLNSDIAIEDMEQALCLLEDFCSSRNIHKIFFRLPPVFYDETYISKFQNCFLRRGYQVFSWDLNYQYFIRDMDYLNSMMKRNGKKNLRIAEEQNYDLVYCATERQKRQAYDIIAVNRKNKGYPLRMSWEAVEATIKKMQHDFFLLYLDWQAVAAAVIFRVNDEIFQVVYWGDIDGYSDKKPMNYLSYHLYEYYLQKGIRVLDIGPSTEDGIPNYGLCRFKESIGCDVSSKVTYVKEI